MTCEGESAQKVSKISSSSGAGPPPQSFLRTGHRGAHERANLSTFLKEDVPESVAPPGFARVTVHWSRTLSKASHGCAGGEKEEEEGGRAESEQKASSHSAAHSVFSSLPSSRSVFVLSFNDRLPADTACGLTAHHPPLSCTARGSYSYRDPCTVRSRSSPAASGNECPLSRPLAEFRHR